MTTTTHSSGRAYTPASSVALQDSFALIGRLLLAYMFIPAGFGKIAGFSGTVGYAASAGLPLPAVGVAIALVIELLGGLALLFGVGTRWAALGLAVFTAVASFYFHNYWALPADQQMMQQLMFGKNLAIVGGLLAFAAFGAGRLSVDARLGKA
jgi:putative oxidoreductase